MTQATFGLLVQKYLSACGHTQKDLAHELYLNYGVLSRKLRGKGGAYFTTDEIISIICVLARWRAITTRDEVQDLLTAAHVPPESISEERWETPPLRQLVINRRVYGVSSTNTSSSWLPSSSYFFIPCTPFVGRQWEMENLLHLLQRTNVRLVTLVGPGGSGKTRLAEQVMYEVAKTLGQQTFFVELAGIHDPDQVPVSIIEAAGLQPPPSISAEQSVLLFFRERQALLVLDNFEQLLAAKSFVSRLLNEAPGVKILLTSREHLHIHEEYQFGVTPLHVPDLDALPSYTELEHYPAVQLFVECVRAKVPEFEVTAENAASIARICVYLDGLPLALELAAPWIKVLSPGELLSRLQRSRLSTLKETSALLPDRQRTLLAAFEWSYDLLKEEEKLLFRRLSIFSGGFSHEAMEAIAGVEGADGGTKLPSSLKNVTALLDKSMLQLILPHDRKEPRLRMLETIREFGLAQLRANGEDEAVSRAHAEYYVRLAEQAEPYLLGGEQGVWLDKLETEHENIQCALQWLLAREHLEAALRLASALYHFWWIRGRGQEGISILERAYLPPASLSPSIRAKALLVAGRLISLQGGLERAELYCSESLSLFQKLGDALNSANAMAALGYIAMLQTNYPLARQREEDALAGLHGQVSPFSTAGPLATLAFIDALQGRYKEAIRKARESLAISTQAQHIPDRVSSLQLLALIYFFRNHANRALEYLEHSLSLARAYGYRLGIGYALTLQAQIVLRQGDTATAQAILEEAMSSFQAFGDQQGIAQVICAQGLTTFAQGDISTARTLLVQSYHLGRAVYNQQIITMSLLGWAGVSAFQDAPEHAVQVIGALEGAWDALGVVLPVPMRELRDFILAAARHHMDEVAFREARARGRGMKPEDVFDNLALSTVRLGL